MTEFLQSILSRLQEIFSPEVLSDLLVRGLANIIVGLIVFIAFYVGWLVLRPLLRIGLQRGGADETTFSFVETLVKYSVLIIGLITALDSAGVQTSAVLASLGIVGLTIGFAARDALSNLISGLLIFLDRPFVIGDLVEMEGESPHRYKNRYKHSAPLVCPNFLRYN